MPKKEDRASNSDLSLWSAVFIRTILIIFAVSVVSQSIISGTPLVVQGAGSSNIYSGVLVAVYIVAMLVARFFSGKIVDAHSRKAAIFLGGLFIVLGSVVSIFFLSLEMLLPARALQGVGFAIAHTGVTSAASDVLPRKRLGEGISYLGLGNAVSMAVGPSYAIWLVGFGDSQALSWGIALMGIFIIVLGVFINYEKNPLSIPKTSGYRMVWEEKQRIKAKGLIEGPEKMPESIKHERPSIFTNLFERSAACGAIPGLLFAFSMPVFISYTTLYAKTLGYTNPSIFFVIAAITAVLVRISSSKIMDSTSPLKIIFVAVFSGIVTCLCIYFIHNEVVYWILGIGYGICLGLMVPVIEFDSHKDCASASLWSQQMLTSFLCMISV